MDTASKSVISFLYLIADVHKRLEEFAARLRKRSDVQTASVIRFSPSGSPLYFAGSEFGVSAFLQNGVTVDWWIQIHWDEDNWRMSYSVLSNDTDEDGCREAVSFPEVEVTSLTEFMQHLTDAISKLIATENNETLFS